MHNRGKGTFHVHFFFSLFARQREEKMNQKRRETRNRLEHPSGAKIEWMNAGRAGTFTKPMVRSAHTVSAKMRTTIATNPPELNGVSNQCR